MNINTFTYEGSSLVRSCKVHMFIYEYGVPLKEDSLSTAALCMGDFFSMVTAALQLLLKDTQF